MHPHNLHAEYMLKRLKTSDAMAGQPCKSDIPISNFKSEIDLANEVLDLRDLTERYWRVITAQHIRIAKLESELLCVKTAKP